MDALACAGPGLGAAVGEGDGERRASVLFLPPWRALCARESSAGQVGSRHEHVHQGSKFCAEAGGALPALAFAGTGTGYVRCLCRCSKGASLPAEVSRVQPPAPSVLCPAYAAGQLLQASCRRSTTGSQTGEAEGT